MHNTAQHKTENPDLPNEKRGRRLALRLEDWGIILGSGGYSKALVVP
jgi:hypothetical protein